MIDFSFYYVYKHCCCFIFDIFTTTTNFLLYYCLRSNSLMTCRSIGKESRNEIACWIPNVNFTALAAGLLLYFFILLKKIAKSYLFRSQSTWAYSRATGTKKPCPTFWFAESLTNLSSEILSFSTVYFRFSVLQKWSEEANINFGAFCYYLAIWPKRE